MKVIYWRWKEGSSKTINKNWIYKDLEEVLELVDSPYSSTSYPTRVLVKDIEIIKITIEEIK